MATALKGKLADVSLEIQKADELGLNLDQQEFCKLYASDVEFFGNGVQSYLEVYDIDRTKPNWYKTALAASSRLLANVKVSNYINFLLEMRGLNDVFVDKQLEFLLTQHADFKSKLGAIHEYNQLKRRVGDGGNKTLILVVSGETAKRYGNLPNGESETSST